MDLAYVITPFVAWFVAGVLKFLINSWRSGRAAVQLVGYGGMPSNHSTIVSSMAALIAFREGVGHPAFGVALTLAFIVILDAASLRRQIGYQAERINQLAASAGNEFGTRLRERMGHHPLEILAGLILGVIVAAILACLLPKSM